MSIQTLEVNVPTFQVNYLRLSLFKTHFLLNFLFRIDKSAFTKTKSFSSGINA